MPLSQTVIAEPDWVRAQNPNLWLTLEEMAVLAAWNSEKRKAEWLAGRMAAKRLLLAELGIKPLDWQIGREGAAPAMVGLVLPNITFSISHSEGLGAATLSDKLTEGSAGIDVQHVRPVHPGLCARVFSLGERQQIKEEFGSENDSAGMLLFWALKEAAIKARRLPWGRSLQSISVRLVSPGSSTIFMEGEPLMTARYAHIGGWWLARAVLPT
ncbi:MAG: 4'-phosphopantetheinyl transferase family protein [Janthinobacterium lividum]